MIKHDQYYAYSLKASILQHLDAFNQAGSRRAFFDLGQYPVKAVLFEFGLRRQLLERNSEGARQCGGKDDGHLFVLAYD